MVRAILLCFVIRAIMKNSGDREFMFLMHLLSCSSIVLRYIGVILADMLPSCIMTLRSFGGYKCPIRLVGFGLLLFDTMVNSLSSLSLRELTFSADD